MACCVAALPLGLSSGSLLAAQQIIERDTIIDGSNPLVGYQVLGGVKLTGNGATTQQIFLREGGALELNGSSIVAADDGVLMEGGRRPSSMAAPLPAKIAASSWPAAGLAVRRPGSMAVP